MDPKGIILVADARSRAGGEGGRGPLHALEHVANRPIVHHVLDALESAGVKDVIVAAPAECVVAVRDCVTAREQRDGVVIRYVDRPGPLDVAGALTLAAPIVGAAPCIVHAADGLLSEPLTPFVDRLSAGSPDVILIVHQGPAPAGRMSPATQHKLHVAELDPERSALGMAGVCLFGPDGLRHASTAAWQTWDDVDFTVLPERVAAQGGKVEVRRIDTWRRYGGDPLDLLELNRIALDRLEPNEFSRPSNTGNRIEGRVHIHESASIRASVIVGPTVIGPGACLADAYIGPYTAVGAGARIEGAEIERSIISERASVMHVGGRLVASVVGRDARIFRDFSLPRALRLRVGDGTVVALC